MKLEKICVRRLKSFQDYSNVAVEVCASLDDTDDIDEAYTNLLLLANSMIRRTRYLEESKEFYERLEQMEQQILQQYNTLKQTVERLEKEKEEVSQLLDEALEVLEKAKTIRQRLTKLTSWIKTK